MIKLKKTFHNRLAFGSSLFAMIIRLIVAAGDMLKMRWKSQSIKDITTC